MVKLGGADKTKMILMAILFLAIGIYLLGAFFQPTTEVVAGVTVNTIEFLLPTDAESVAFNILKYVIIGALAFAAIGLSSKVGSTAMTKKDYFSLVIVAIAGIFLYMYVLQPILGSANIGSIEFGIKNALAP